MVVSAKCAYSNSHQMQPSSYSKVKNKSWGIISWYNYLAPHFDAWASHTHGHVVFIPYYAGYEDENKLLICTGTTSEWLLLWVYNCSLASYIAISFSSGKFPTPCMQGLEGSVNESNKMWQVAQWGWGVSTSDLFWKLLHVYCTSHTGCAVVSVL